MSRQRLWRACKKGAPKPKKGESEDWSEPFESNFDEVVENITKESQKSNYNPETDMNWCNLPMEMRRECVKRMDFQTRCGFREVSKFEKSLVDSKKYKFEHFQINFVWDSFKNRMIGWDIIAKSGHKEPELHIRTEDRLNEKCLSAIFKYAEVKNFRLTTSNRAKYKVRPILEQLENFAPFPFKRVAVFGNRSTDFFMQTCPNLEKVDVDIHLPYRKMLKLRSLMKIKEFKLWNVWPSDLLDFVPRLVQKWIDNDAEVGKSVQCLNGLQWRVPPGTRRLVDTFAEKFADRVIEKTDIEVRIRMNNEKKQILVRDLDLEEDSSDYSLCSCKVIPIDLQKSEYGKGDEWIQVFYERRLKSYGRLEKAMEFDAEDQEIFDGEL